MVQTVDWFCADAQCDVVYFTADSRTYSKQDVLVPVWQTKPAGGQRCAIASTKPNQPVAPRSDRPGNQRCSESVGGPVSAPSRRSNCRPIGGAPAQCLGERSQVHDELPPLPFGQVAERRHSRERAAGADFPKQRSVALRLDIGCREIRRLRRATTSLTVTRAAPLIENPCPSGPNVRPIGERIASCDRRWRRGPGCVPWPDKLC